MHATTDIQAKPGIEAKVDSQASATDSDIIQIARVLCIYFMIHVHLYPGFDVIVLPDWMMPIRIVVSDIFGRASVPLLSIISGYLAISSFSKRGYGSAIRTKALTLMSTLALWNVFAIALALIAWSAMGTETDALLELSSATLPQVVYSLIFSVDNGSLQLSHAFLRDLFMCFALVPIIQVYCSRLNPLLGMVLLCAFIYLVGIEPVIYRENILICFVAGVYLQQINFRLGSIERWAFLVIPAFLVFAWIEFTGRVELYEIHDVVQLAKRFAVASTILLASTWLAKTFLRRFLLKISRPVFLVFLSHNLGFGVIWSVWMLAQGPEINSAYVIYLFGAPLIVWAIAYLIYPWLLRLPSAMRIPLIGK
jgi:hypothetical protein